ncbi:MAG: hypothetical protein JSS86_00010 [Cyanobacteria bacterium SZAS LIN-2]|nr:hypothetical protein [Cyanobacteria bacterium SZAS LIN-2]
MKLLPLILTIHVSLAVAAPVTVDVLEKSTGQTTSVQFDAKTAAIRPASPGARLEIPQLARYAVVDRSLVVGGVAISKADDLLYQCEADGFDIVVVRVEHNSFSNPFRWLTALAGHPIQVSTIYIETIKDKTIVARREIVFKPASYEWAAKVSR